MKRLSWLFVCFFLSVLTVTTLAQQNANTRLTIKSAVLNEERVALIRTPPGYEQSGLRYPVLYMTDGAAHVAHTVATIEFLVRNGRMPELIVVAITNTDRTRDLTPTNATMPRPDGGQPFTFPTSGGADKFLKFIETELIPKVESSYRTEPYRIFAGHSFGGLFALHAFLTRTEVFNAYIAVSPSMHWDNHLLSRRAEAFFKDRQELNRTLYVTLANEGGEMKAGFERLQKILSKQQAKHFEWGASLMEDEDHGSVVMRSHYQGLRKIFDGWLLVADATGNISGSLAGVEAHYQKLSSRYSFKVLPPEALINQLGYQLLGQKKTDEAIVVFKANIDRYPNSANVYDSLAEAYETSGQLEQARSHYEKAMQVGEKNNDPALQAYKTNFERVSEQLKKKMAGKE